MQDSSAADTLDRVLERDTPAPSRAERRDQQVQRILDAAKACFLRSGFQGASMQQICAEAGMSPGALYRYFPSKEAIIEAICEADRARTPAVRRDPRESQRRRRLRRRRDGPYPPHPRERNAPLFAEICAESMRNEAVRAIGERCMGEVQANVPRLSRRRHGRAARSIRSSSSMRCCR